MLKNTTLILLGSLLCVGEALAGTDWTLLLTNSTANEKSISWGGKKHCWYPLEVKQGEPIRVDGHRKYHVRVELEEENSFTCAIGVVSPIPFTKYIVFQSQFHTIKLEAYYGPPDGGSGQHDNQKCVVITDNRSKKEDRSCKTGPYGGGGAFEVTVKLMLGDNAQGESKIVANLDVRR